MNQVNRIILIINLDYEIFTALQFALAAQSGFSKHDCAEFLNLNAMIDGAVAGSEDPYPSSYERLQNLNDIVIKR